MRAIFFPFYTGCLQFEAKISRFPFLPPDDAVTRHVCRRAEKARLAEKFFGRPGLAEFFYRRRD